MPASVPEFPAYAPRATSPMWNPISSDAAPGSLTLRIFAYLIDLVIVGFIAVVLAGALVVLGFLSFGASWLLIAPVWVATPIAYSGLTLSSRAQATLGMRLFGLRLASVEGHPIDFVTAAAHVLLFYIFASTMTPLILAVGLFRHDRALLHDLVLRVRLVAAWSR